MEVAPLLLNKELSENGQWLNLASDALLVKHNVLLMVAQWENYILDAQRDRITLCVRKEDGMVR